MVCGLLYAMTSGCCMVCVLFYGMWAVLMYVDSCMVCTLLYDM